MVANAAGMKYRNAVACIFLSTLLFVSPLSIASQEKISRDSLARMDVLSRARLFDRVVEKAARSEGVDPHILWTIAYNETRFRPWLTSPKNARGMMQFIPATAARFGLADPYDPNASLFAAARYVKFLGRLFDWKLESILAAYNAGEGTVSAYLNGRELRAGGKVINPSRSRTANGVPPYKETVSYVAQGVKVYRWLRQQGRFTRDPQSDPAFTTAEAPIANKPAEKQITSVFYEPRTGKRRVISSEEHDSDRELVPGPVIVGPSIPTNATSRARSTFAGLISRSDVKK